MTIIRANNIARRKSREYIILQVYKQQETFIRNLQFAIHTYIAFQV